MRHCWLLVLVGCAAPPPLPGDLVVISPGDITSVQVEGDTIFWVRAEALYTASLANAPIDEESLVAAGNATAAPAIDQGRAFVANGRDVDMLAGGKTTHVATADLAIDRVAVDRHASPTLVWTAGATVYSAPLAGGIPTRTAIPGVDGIVALAGNADAWFVATENALGPTGAHGALWRISRATAVAQQLVDTRDLAALFPIDPFIEANRPGDATYTPSALVLDDRGLVLGVRETNFIGGLDRDILVDIPLAGGTPRALVAPMFETWRWFVSGDRFYWIEPRTDVVKHYPLDDADAKLALWTAPRTGGAPSVALEQLDVRAIVDGQVYCVVPDGVAFADIRRVALP